MDGNSVRLGWTLPTGAGLSAMQLEGGLRPGESLGAIRLPVAPEATLTLPAGTLYLRLRGVVAGALTDATNELAVHVGTPLAPSQPANLMASVDASTLAWTNTFSGGRPENVTLRVTGAADASIPLGLIDTFRATGVPPGTYTLAVIATNANGSSPPSRPVALTVPATCSGAPGGVTNFIAYRSGATVYLNWDLPLGGEAPTYYVVSSTGAYAGSVTTAQKYLSAAVPPGSYTLSVAGVN